jgi:hypothetical protein
MRAAEFVSEVINPDIQHGKFSHELEIDGVLYKAKTLKSDQLFVVRAYVPSPAGNTCIGFAKFQFPRNDAGSLASQWTKVAGPYRNKGIASNMYAYARMLGNSINPGKFQLDPGRKMWDKWREKGDAKHLGENDDDMFAPEPKKHFNRRQIDRVGGNELQYIRNYLARHDVYGQLQQKVTALVLKTEELDDKMLEFVNRYLTQTGLKYEIKRQHVDSARGSYTNTLIKIPNIQQ